MVIIGFVFIIMITPNVILFRKFGKTNHMHLIHNVKVCNGGTIDMKHNTMPPSLTPPLQSIITTKLILVIGWLQGKVTQI